MRVIIVCVMLFACGPMTPIDTTVPLTEETCDSKLMRAEDLIDKYQVFIEDSSAAVEEAKVSLDLCMYQREQQYEKLQTCNIATSVYESDLLSNGCITMGNTDEETHQEEQ